MGLMTMPALSPTPHEGRPGGGDSSVGVHTHQDWLPAALWEHPWEPGEPVGVMPER